MGSPLWTLSLILAICIQSLQAYSAADVKTLMDAVVNVNNANIRPVQNDLTQTTVYLNVYPLNILSFDEVAQRLTGTMYMQISWYDEVLTWDPSAYNYIYKVDPDPKYVWRPDLAIANSYGAVETLGGSFILLHLYADGQINWFPGLVFDVLCEVDVTKYPFDTQTCYFEFFSWGAQLSEIKLVLRDDGFDLKSYLPNGEWELTSTWATYPNSTFGTISNVRVYMALRRYPAFIFVSTLLPVFLLAFLNSLVFIIPVDSGEKISYAITLLLSLAVFLSFITDQMPRTSTSVATATVVLALQMAFSSVYIVLTIIILRIYHKDEEDPMPACLARVALLECVCSSRNRVTNGGDTSPKQPVQAFSEKASWKKLAVVIDTTCFVIALVLSTTVTTVYFVVVLS